MGPKVVPFWGSYLELYMVIPKSNYFGAYGEYLDPEALDAELVSYRRLRALRYCLTQCIYLFAHG